MELARTELKALETVIEEIREAQKDELDQLRMTLGNGGLAETIL
jgi:hypothetical protein